MSEPALSPADTLSNVEGTRSTSPTQGAGLHAEARSPHHETLFLGRVEDSYGTAGGYLVALYHYKRNFPCFPLRAAGGRFFGVRSHAVLPTGTEVLCYVPRDGKFGIILGPTPTVEDPPFGRSATQLVPEGGVNVFSDQEAFDAAQFGVGGLLPQAFAGAPVDALPGDAGCLNENEVGFGANRLMSFVRAGDLAAVEAHVLGDLLRVVGHRLEILTAQGEERINNDYGRINRERLVALTQAESLGVAQDGEDPNTANPDATLTKTPLESSLRPTLPGAQLRVRLREDEGALGDLRQTHLCRPAQTPRALDGTGAGDPPPDLTLYHELLTRTGRHLERSLVGGGSVKSLGIAGPRRLRTDDDPTGDRAVANPAERKAFRIDPDVSAAGFSAQVRDFLAWSFDQEGKVARADLSKDWSTPGDADALTPNEDFFTPGVGGFYRDAPPMVDAAKSVADVPDETKEASTPFRPGESFTLLLPDGSTLTRDAWGTEIRTGYGHAEITASHDLRLTAGGSIVLQAGDDIVLRARQAVDLSSSENQVRLKAQKDVLVDAEMGGMLFTAPTAGAKAKDYSDPKAQGEGATYAGIAFRTGGTVTTAAQASVFALTDYHYIGGGPEGGHPAIYTRTSQESHWSDGSACWSTGSGGGTTGAMINGGNFYATGTIQNDGSLYVRGSVGAGGGVSGGEDFSKVDQISSDLAPAFDPKQFADLQAPYALADLPNLKFTFRTTDECAAADLKLFESAWQRELADDLSAWEEKAINATYPWPGADHYDGSTQGFFTYEEANVQLDGTPKARGDQSAEGGTFTPHDFLEFPVLPAR